ncbi:probable myosin light chain kinase DDB_G0271550 isoform X1 [Hydra vulgaris]|uniref:probable myosin light chain kinase DDB_G0271550 isoform X1 n=1 Tax=Hydra vulgaris TaxID=6087 RepID=UPI001F5F71EF|nr:probable myosin light chain kinase DDB_G0271550 [Hydra vulgaris]XP_047137703.1 probable myosin light chain kinase DDB_G0271550 [Hydra vulgaris]XP_047137704.1 probable myosin light chain kinase DDB_G0271550 [Hydra vulgaris]XP_047137705.1 probable myosin light chain kinase DDB_G0271550 [Hydra vulgaris]
MTIDNKLERVVKELISYDEKYEILEELGKGSFGSVSKCRNKETRVLVAAKFIRKTAKSKVEFENEVNVMRKLNHKYLIKLYDAFETRRQLIIVMELVSGQELFQKCAQEEVQLTEYQVARYMRQILEGVNHMHEKNIVHLDLKPENILCSGNMDEDEIKIIDFGFSRELKSEEQNKVICGTAEFIAPEVISFNPITLKTDMWSIGVITYVLLSGISPFLGGNDNETFDNVTIGDYSYNVEDNIFDTISEEAKNLIDCCLQYKPCRRISVEEALNHKWLNKLKGLQLVLDNKENLNQFLNRRRWQRIFNTVKAAGRFYSIIKSGFDNQECTDSDQDDSIETELTFNRISNLAKKDLNSDLQTSCSQSRKKSDEKIDDVSPRSVLQEVIVSGDHSDIYCNNTYRSTDTNNNNINYCDQLKCDTFGKNNIEMDVDNIERMEVEKTIISETEITPKNSIEKLCFSSSVNDCVKIISKEERMLRRNIDKKENFMLTAEIQQKHRTKRLSTSDCESIQEEDDELKLAIKKNKDGRSNEETSKTKILDQGYLQGDQDYLQFEKNEVTAKLKIDNALKPDSIKKAEPTPNKKGFKNSTIIKETSPVLQTKGKSDQYRNNEKSTEQNLITLNKTNISQIPENVQNLKISKIDSCKILDVKNDNNQQHSKKFFFQEKKPAPKNVISVTDKKPTAKVNFVSENKSLGKPNSTKETKPQAKGVNITNKIAFFQK